MPDNADLWTGSGKEAVALLGPYSEWIALWGAVIATGLAAIRVYELWRDRQRVGFSYSFTGDPDRGNEVTIVNHSSRPLMLGYWELLWMKRKWLVAWSTTSGRFPRSGSYHVTIPPYEFHTLYFRDEEHFSWGPRHRSGHKLFLKLHVQGRKRPLWLSIYKPK